MIWVYCVVCVCFYVLVLAAYLFVNPDVITDDDDLNIDLWLFLLQHNAVQQPIKWFR